MFFSNMNVKKIPLGEGQYIISSSSEDQRSWESTRYKNGVFTHALMDGLRKNARLEDGRQVGGCHFVEIGFTGEYCQEVQNVEE